MTTTTHEPDDCFDCARIAQERAEAREATANRVYSVKEHRRERRYAANLAARWQG